MSKPFKGVVNVDIRDSVPDWSPFEAPKAPEGSPSVLYIVLDDVGFSALGPFKMWKRYEFNGGTSDPCIVSWPKGIKARGEIREQYHHAIDLVRTILDCLGVEPPETIGGHVQSDFDGVSMRYSFDHDAMPSARTTQFYSMLGSRAIWHDGWKAVTNHASVSGWGHFGKDTWELYHTDVDRSEVHDLADQEPESPSDSGS